MKARVWSFLDVSKEGDRWGRFFDLFMIALIVTNVIAVIVESIPSMGQGLKKEFFRFEVFSVIVFTLEYAGRFWSCTADKQFQGTFKGRIKFFWRPMNLIDLASVLPFYLPFLGIDGRMLRILRIIRIIRIAKLGKYSHAFQLMGKVIREKKEELVITSSIMGLILILAAATIYHFEKDVQPDEFSSIPAAMWWAVATLTTVGYGDVYPITIGGKIAAAIVAITSIGFFALPTGILGAGFVEEISNKDAKTVCPHCGREI